MQTSSEKVIEVRGLAKRYRLDELQTLHGSLREALVRGTARTLRLMAGQRARYDWIWALDHVTLDVGRGEVLGIIGSNGAGKTTLLKLLSEITQPTEGEARVWGKVGALLEVGTGFHPDLTGRDNVFLNGAILGMKRREIARKFDEIVDFAEVERFIDTPVKRYSSGMQLRLAFAVAAHLEPDILVVDEVLAVGDAAFQRKCLGKMGEVSGEGRTVLLVSHNLSAIASLSSRCVWLDEGRIRMSGAPPEVVGAYLSQGHRSDQPGFEDLTVPAVRSGVQKHAYGDVVFESVRLLDAEGRTTGVFFEQERMRILLGLRTHVRTAHIEVLCKFSMLDGTLVFTLTSGPLEVELRPGRFELPVEIPSLPLRRGTYQIDLYVLTKLPQDYLAGAIEFEVAGLRVPADDPRRTTDHLGVVSVEHEWGSVEQLESSPSGV